jgi:hypothetical protein
VTDVVVRTATQRSNPSDDLVRFLTAVLDRYSTVELSVKPFNCSGDWLTDSTQFVLESEEDHNIVDTTVNALLWSEPVLLKLLRLNSHRRSNYIISILNSIQILQK